MKKQQTLQTEEYKQTELGELPKEWGVVRLKELLKQVSKKNKENKKYTVYTISNKIGFLPSDDFFNKQVYSKKLNTYKIVEKDCFAYNPYRINIGSIGIFKENMGVVSPAYIVFEITKKNKLLPQYLFLILKSQIYLNEIMRLSMSRGSVRRSLSFNDLKDFEVSLPPFPEQQKIAYVLSTIQNAQEKTENFINSLKEFKKSAMKHLFTYGAVPFDEIDKVELKETEIGMMPKSWEIIELKDGGTFQYGYTETSSEQKIGPKFLRITDIDLNVNKILWGTVPYCKIESKELPKYKLNEGDILIARIGATTGKTCIVKNPPESVFASYLIRFISNNKKMFPEFIYYFTTSDTYWKQINANKEGKLKKGVSSSQLKNFKIIMPSLPEQQHIASILSTIDEKIQAEEQKKEALKEIFNSLLKNLMTAKIRVNNLEVGV